MCFWKFISMDAMASMFAKPADITINDSENQVFESSCKFMKMNSFCIKIMKTIKIDIF